MDMKFLIVFVLFALLKQAGGASYDGTDPPLCDDCAGICDNGECVCGTDYVTLCVPTSCIMEDNTCCSAVQGYYWDSLVFQCTDEFRCNPACGIDEECVNKSLVAVCECNNTAYVGKTIADFKPTVECDSGTMTTSVSRCLLTYLGYDYTSLHIRDDSIECSYHYPTTHNNMNMEETQVRAAAGWCNNTHMTNNSQVYYTNTLHINPLNSVLITKNPIAYDFTCGYNLTMQTSLEYALRPALSTTVIAPVTGGGLFSVTMAAYKDKDCTVIWEDGQSVDVGTDIYLGIFTPDADATTFTLRVDKCFATPSNDSNDSTSVPLVSGGCAITEQVDTEILGNGISLEGRIRIKAFQFQNSPNNLFIFCQVSLCPKSDACKQCLTGRSLNGNSAQLGLGFTLEDNTYSSNSGSHTAFSYVMMAASLIAFLCMNFF